MVLDATTKKIIKGGEEKVESFLKLAGIGREIAREAQNSAIRRNSAAFKHFDTLLQAAIQFLTISTTGFIASLAFPNAPNITYIRLALIGSALLSLFTILLILHQRNKLLVSFAKMISAVENSYESQLKTVIRLLDREAGQLNEITKKLKEKLGHRKS